MGAILCSLVILLFLGRMADDVHRHFDIASVGLVAIVCLNYSGQTINVMTLAGLTLAIGPMIDSAIICLENTHRHLSLGATPRQAALLGASEVAMPELVSTLCTFLVLSPSGSDAGHGQIPFHADDPGGDVRHDGGLFPVAHPGSLLQRLPALGSSSAPAETSRNVEADPGEPGRAFCPLAADD